MTEIAIDFFFWAGLFALVSPLIVSAVKNIGGSWPQGAKQAIAVLMALIGSVIAFGVSAGWESVNLGDFEGFWQPLIIGVAGIFSVQYASYKGLWNDTKVLAVADSLGTSDS